MIRQLYWIPALLLFVLLLVIGLTEGINKEEFIQLPDSFLHYDKTSVNHIVWINIRLPRLLLAFITGAALGLSGYLMQVLVRNPLADPYVLGSSSGASLFAAIFFILLPPAALSLTLLLILTFCGAFGTNILSLFLSRVRGEISPYRMILVGIAISGMAMSLVSLLMYTAGEDQSWKSIIFWTFGSFQSASWEKVLFLSVLVSIISIICYLLFYPIQVMELGAENANRIGVSVTIYRILILLLSSLLTAAAVSMAGPIGFLGLIMPHLLRIVFKFQLNKRFIPWLCYSSGIFLMFCEIISTMIFPPQGIPAGILMSILGVPFFLFLLLKTSDKYL
jgi:iron complex transport system permease protein